MSPIATTFFPVIGQQNVVEQRANMLYITVFRWGRLMSVALRVLKVLHR